jgi:hypothetical protein
VGSCPQHSRSRRVHLIKRSPVSIKKTLRPARRLTARRFLSNHNLLPVVLRASPCASFRIPRAETRQTPCAAPYSGRGGRVPLHGPWDSHCPCRSGRIAIMKEENLILRRLFLGHLA